MFTIMIVDDEIGVRNSIKAKIDWEALGFRIILEASNGEAALQLLDKEPLPDVVISDIRMPQMDGIEFVRNCKERHPFLRIVVLSGYSDFEYMKAAIQLGVKDYLLKPVVRSELISLLSKLSDELKEDRHRTLEKQLDQIKNSQQLQILQEQLLLQLVKDEWLSLSVIKERLQQLNLSNIAVEGLNAQFITAEMRIPQGRLEDWSERKDLMNLAFQMLCRETAERWEGIYPFYDVSHPSMMYFLIILDEPKVQNDLADRYVNELRNNIKKYLRVESVIGLGEPVKGLQRLKNGYTSSILAWSQSTTQQATFHREMSLLELTHQFSPEMERKLVIAIENLDMKAFNKQVQSIFSLDQDYPMFVFTFLSLRIILLFNSIAKKFEIGDTSLQKYLWNCQMTIRDYPSREQVLNQLHDLAQLVMDEVKKTRFSNGQHMVEAVRNYVEENFSYELTLSFLAEMFHMNETYLSGLFKQRVGMTFSDYVTKLRLNKAELLLKEEELKLTDIAMLVGYSSSSYFSTAFKKFHGKSPKEFREDLLSINTN
jgi:two-component system response regulator YesN